MTKSFKVTFEVSEAMVKNLISSLTTTYSPWLHELSWKNKKTFILKVKFDRENDNEGDGKGKKTIIWRTVERGLSAMTKEAPHSLAAILEDNIDSPTADAFMQCVVFGRLIYG